MHNYIFPGVADTLLLPHDPTPPHPAPPTTCNLKETSMLTSFYIEICYFGLISSAKKVDKKKHMHRHVGTSTSYSFVRGSTGGGTSRIFCSMRVVIPARTNMYGVICWLNVIQLVHICDRSNNAHHFKNKSTVCLILYSILQCNCPKPLSHTSEKTDIQTKGDRAFVGMHCMYCTNARPASCTTRFLEPLPTLAGHHQIHQTAKDFFRGGLTDECDPVPTRLPEAERPLPNCHLVHQMTYNPSSRLTRIYESRAAAAPTACRGPAGKVSHTITLLLKVSAWIPAKRPQPLRGPVAQARARARAWTRTLQLLLRFPTLPSAGRVAARRLGVALVTGWMETGELFGMR